ncbi:G1 family glutamic endopeptidase [Kitasatospora viridis]|uniref:Peptidase A4-like protein n=1 Tax=Kitasatospora viridis TaxID=281105 RepID=A0A561UPP9_9ACTN|nr:G1 family glutamic endopeptidase [Kitasatospora viridis]TWG01335.1 peptidase A4-like protein [Kitasatospora viridis]
MIHARLRAAAAAAALALAASAAAATPAFAAPAGHAYGPAHTHSHGHRYDGGVWGGYVATGSNFQSISGSWTMPQVTCNTSNDLFAPWVGIDGYGSQTVEQTGVQVDCSSGSPVYSAWYEMYPADPQYWSDPVSAGDNFTGSVTTDGSGNYTLTLTDNTAGWSENTQQSLNGQNVSAEAVIESPSQSYPSFNELDFTGVTVNGQSFDQSSPQAIDSGQYTETALQGGSFSIVPAGGAGFARAHATRPANIHY